MPRRENSKPDASSLSVSRQRPVRAQRGNVDVGDSALVSDVPAQIQRSPQQRSHRTQDQERRARPAVPALNVEDLNLINQRWEMTKDGVKKVLNDNQEFLVIGVLGGPCSGKSTLLNNICGLSPNAQFASSQTFAVGTVEDKACDRHSTGGIDVRVTKDRIIALDTQPVFSSSVLLELLTSPSPCMELARILSVMAARGARPPKTSAEAINLIMAIQMAVFLFNVCHLVLVVCDGPEDHRMWQLIEAASVFAPLVSLATATPSNNQDNVKGPRPLGEAVFLHTKMSSNEMAPGKIADLENQLKGMMAGSKLCKKGFVSCWSAAALNEPNSHKEEFGQSKEQGVSFFVLPRNSPTISTMSDDKKDGSDSIYSAMLQTLQRQLLGYPQWHFGQGLTEREWLLWAEKVWQSVMKSKDIAEYFITLQNRTFKGAGGW